MRVRFMITLPTKMGEMAREVESALREQVDPYFSLEKYATAIISTKIAELYSMGSAASKEAANKETTDDQSQSK